MTIQPELGTEPTKAVVVGDVALRRNAAGGTDLVMVRHGRVIGRAYGHLSGYIGLNFTDAGFLDADLLRDVAALLDLHTTDRATGQVIPKDQP